MNRQTILILALIVLSAAAGSAPEPIKSDVFVGGQDGYHTYRIPALTITNQGTVLAFCEARKNSPNDQGDIDLVLRRSFDGGHSWEPMQHVHEEGGDAPITIGNPAPIVAHGSDTIHLFFTRNNKRLFYTRSTDDGRSWAAPEERTEILHDIEFPWRRIASGPVHGIQLSNGALVVPMWYCDEEPDAPEKRYQAGVIFGNSEGTRWQAGGLVPESIPGLNECTVLERKDGSLLLNMRAQQADYRAIAESTDHGRTWSTPVLDQSLPDPTCQGSILRLADGDIVFSNIPARDRSGLSLRRSQDEGRRWSRTRELEAGPSAYSDLAQRADGIILCLYERGQTRYNEKISIAHIDPAWLAPVTEKP